MPSYQIATSTTVLGDVGDTVTEEQLEGCNVEALVAGGHLVPVKPKSSISTADKAETKKE